MPTWLAWRTNEYVQLSGITLLNGSSTQLASTQYSYDGDQRPTSLTTNWLPGSGNSGEILGQSRSYDNASNVTSTNAFFAGVPGQSSSGGSEVQNFCYDSLNRLVWSGNGGTQPGAGNGTCGSGVLANSLTGAGYTAPYSYTNLGQIWQGPLDGSGGTEQYLYCNTAPHQLSGIYPTGTTCSNKGSATAVYSATYDAWGNQSSQTYNGTLAGFSYDPFNRLVEYNATSGKVGQEFYVYDASGERVFKRSTSGGTTTLTAYVFGLQELTYTGAGAFSSQTDYYSIAGHLIGSTNGSATTYDLTDAQGSVLLSLSASAVTGEQVLDYYNARYYDPVMAQFLSADNVQGNAQGADPYVYVAGNPETATDPTGQALVIDGGIGNKYALSKNPTTKQPYANVNHTPPVPVQQSNHIGANRATASNSSNNSNSSNKNNQSAKKKPTASQIQNAQADAQQEATKLFAIAGIMLLLIADLPGWIAKLQQAALYFAGLAAVDVWNIVGTVVFGALAIAAEGAAVFLAGSMVTLVLGALADSRLAALFEQQATDNNPADWTSAALGQFRSQIDGFTGIVNVASTILSLLTGNTVISKVIGVAEPTTNILYDFSGIDDALNQMSADIGS